MNRLALSITILTVLCLFPKTASPSRSLSDEQPAGERTTIPGTIEKPPSDPARTPYFEQALAMVDHASIAESILPLVLPRTSQSPVWTTDIFAGTAFADPQGELYTVGVSFEKRLYKELSIAFQPFGGVGVGKSDTSGVVGLDALLKHPIYKNKIFTVNFEGGGGLQYAGSKSWPRDGSHFNWRPQVGFGVRFNTGDDSQLLFGARYLHISNGGINSDSNCGVDEVFLYGGFQLTF